jgi:hypothetical protein
VGFCELQAVKNKIMLIEVGHMTEIYENSSLFVAASSSI